MTRPRFRTLAHGADLRVAIWGEGEQDLIANAVVAAVTLALGGTRQVGRRRRAAIRPWPAALESRLVRAVNEALFALYLRHEAATGVELTARGAQLLLGALPDCAVPELEIKAATYHDLSPRRREGRLSALLTLDV